MIDREQYRKQFLQETGWATARRETLAGDASTRRYERLFLNDRQALLMEAPPQLETASCPPEASPQDRQALGYNASARLAGANLHAFVSIAEVLIGNGFSAPLIYALDAEVGLALIEDLGDQIYAATIAAGEDEKELYRAAIKVLTEISQRGFRPKENPHYHLLEYDHLALISEVRLLIEWYWPLKHPHTITSDIEAEYLALWGDCFAHLSPPDTLVLRDFHAENLLWLPERQGIERTGLIDFQDALWGHKAYDLVSLLEDARRDVAPDLAHYLKKVYCEYLGMTAQQKAHFETDYAILGAQRNAKILGIFARLSERDGKKQYIDLLPRVEQYFRANLQHDLLAPLKLFFRRHFPELIA